MTTGSYTLTTSNNSTITLTGDATITVGSGTNQGWGIADVGGGTNVGAGTATIDCVLAGSHGMYKAGAGTLYLTRSNSYSGVTTVGGGVLSIGNGGTAGGIAGNVTNLAQLDFNRSDTYTYTGTISGTGCVNIVGGTGGTGRTVFTGNQTYTGLTSIAGGTLQIGNGGTSGNIAGDIVIGDLATVGQVSHGVLAFDRSDTLTYAGNIYGTGGVQQIGAGRTILTGIDTYTGMTTVKSGTLEIDNATFVERPAHLSRGYPRRCFGLGLDGRRPARCRAGRYHVRPHQGLDRHQRSDVGVYRRQQPDNHHGRPRTLHPRPARHRGRQPARLRLATADEGIVSNLPILRQRSTPTVA